MTRTLLTLVLSAGLLVGCATKSEPKLAVCDGKQRRPVNLFGSVLTPDNAVPAPEAGTANSPGPLSALDQTFASCRA